MQKQARFQWKPFIRSVCTIAVPVALQNLMTNTGTVVGTMMIAPPGETAVGAAGLCAQYAGLMFTGYWGFVGGSAQFFSQYWGVKDEDGIDRSYGIMLTCMMIVSLIFSLGAIFAPQIAMGILTDKPRLQAIGMDYLRIAGFGYLFSTLSTAMSTLLRNTGRMRIPLYASIASVMTNLCLTGLKWHAPFALIFACTYIDESFRFVLMRLHLRTGKWIRPVTPEDLAALPEFLENLHWKKH